MARTRDGYDAVRGAPAANHLCPPHLSRGRSQQIFPSKSVSNNIRGPATPRGIADATQPPHISTHESSFNDPPPPLLPYNKLHRFSLIRLALFIPRAYLQADREIVRCKGRVSKLLFLFLRKLGIFLHCNFLLFERINIFKDFLNDPKGGHILLFSRVLNIVSEHSFCNYSFLDSHTRSRRWNVYLDSVSTVSAEGWFSREERGAYRGGVSGRRFAYLSPRVPRCQR